MKSKLFAKDGLITHFAFDAGMMVGGAVSLTILILIAGAIHSTKIVGITVASILCTLYLFWFLIFGALVIEKIHKINREPSIHLSWACFKVGFSIAIKMSYLALHITYVVLQIFVKSGLRRFHFKDLPTTDIDRDIERELAYSQ